MLIVGIVWWIIGFISLIKWLKEDEQTIQLSEILYILLIPCFGILIPLMIWEFKPITKFVGFIFITWHKILSIKILDFSKEKK